LLERALLRLGSGGALALGLLLVGCPDGSRDKSEAAAVSRSVTSLRDADNEKKRDHLASLRATECSAPDVCAVRSTCLAGYEVLVETLRRVREIAANPDAGSGTGVDELKRDLARASDLTAKCTDAQGEMIRRYKL
jgi:hypothetical protein